MTTQNLKSHNGNEDDVRVDVKRQRDEEISANITSKDTIDGGSLFSYRIPKGKDAWKTETWTRSIIATGFHVHGQLGNMINPGAPGFW